MNIKPWLFGSSFFLAFILACFIYLKYFNQNYSNEPTVFERQYQDCGSDVALHAGNVSSGCQK